MQQILGAIRSTYNFFVGDPVILTGIAVFFVLIGLYLHQMPDAGSSLAFPVILLIGVISSLSLALYRETRPKH